MRKISNSVEGSGLVKVDPQHIVDVCMINMKNKNAQLTQGLARAAHEGIRFTSMLETTRAKLATPLQEWTRQRDRMNEPTISTACSRKILSSTSIIILSQVDPTVANLTQELSATKSPVNRLNWELTSSTHHVADLENQLNHTQDMYHSLLHQESQQLRKKPPAYSTDWTGIRRTNKPFSEYRWEQPFAHRGKQPSASTMLCTEQPFCGVYDTSKHNGSQAKCNIGQLWRVT